MVSERQVEAKKTADTVVVEKTSKYTVESIIKGRSGVTSLDGDAESGMVRRF